MLFDKSKCKNSPDFCPCQIILFSFWWKHETSFAKLFLWILFSASFPFLLPCLIYLPMAQSLIYVHWDDRYISCKWYQLFFFVTLYTQRTDSLNCICGKNPLQIVINYTLRKMYSTFELSEKGKKKEFFSLLKICFFFIMEQLKNTVLLLPCSSESASWVKIYFWVLKIKIWKSYNSLHGSSSYVRLTKIAFEL